MARINGQPALMAKNEGENAERIKWVTSYCYKNIFILASYHH